MSDSVSLSRLQERSERFLQTTGRRPRILLSSSQKDTSSKHVKASAVVFADAGFDVDIGPAVSTFEVIAKMASENDVHAVGITGSGPVQPDQADQMQKALLACGETHIKVVVENDAAHFDATGDHAEFEQQVMKTVLKTLELIGA